MSTPKTKFINIQTINKMKDIKSIISSRVALGAIVTKKCTIRSISLLEKADNGRVPAIIRLNKLVPAMVQVNQQMIDAKNKHIVELEAAIKAEKDAEKKATLTTELEEEKVWITNHPLDSWFKGERDIIFSSNFDLVAILRQTPKTAFLAKMIVTLIEADEVDTASDILNEIYSFGTTSVLAEDVRANTEYCSPFSDNVSTVSNDSTYHTLFNVEFGDDGLSFVKQMHRRHMDKLAAKLDNISGKKSSRDDDDDEDNDD